MYVKICYRIHAVFTGFNILFQALYEIYGTKIDLTLIFTEKFLLNISELFRKNFYL